MSILITGSSSYIGKNLINFFEENKIDYIGIDKAKPYTKKCLKLDIKSLKINTKIRKKINVIIHLAAVSSNLESKNNPILSYQTNIFGTSNIINFALDKKIKNFIFASTEWVYGEFKKKEIKSIDSHIKTEELISDYAKSKAMTEKLIMSTRGLNYSILRFGIIYGNKKFNYSAVESIIEQVKKNKKIIVQSKKTSRSFIHIIDIVKAINLSLELKKKCILDIQGPNLVSLEKIINLSSNFLKKNVKIVETNKKNCSVRSINSNKSNKILDFKPDVSILKGIDLILKKNEKRI